MRKQYIILCFIILSSIISFSQNGILKEVVPPLPETASFNEGYSAKMNGYQGNLNYNIPIYMINRDGLQIPISLTYASNSNKVRNRASRIGLGWTLFAGGMISRSIRDLPDENPNGFLECFKCNEEFENDLSVRQRILSKIGYNKETTYVDLEPDLYQFNFLEYSGKFIIDNSTYKAIVQETNDLRIDIEFKSGTKEVQKIVFTDLQGNKYYFGMSKDNTKNAYERFQKTEGNSFNTSNSTTSANNSGDPTANSIVGWALLEIELSNKEKIIFNYTKQDVRYQSITSVSVPNENNNSEIIGYNTTTGSELVMQNIKFSQAEVLFEYNTNTREDLFGSKALKGIKIRDNKGYLIKDVLLEHFYTTHSNKTNVIPVLDLDNTSYKRLLLKNVKQYDRDSKTYKPLYQFEYNLLALPSVHSTSVDVWGYFNNANNKFYLFNRKYTNRKIDKTYSQASLLKKVTLQTGGYTEFLYEFNDFKKPRNYKDFFIQGLDYTNYLNLKKEEQYESVGMAKSARYYDNVMNHFITDFSINTISKEASIEVDYMAPPGCEISATNKCMYSVEIRDDKGKLVYHSFNNGKTNIRLNNGNYKLLVVAKRPVDIFDFEQGAFGILLSWKKELYKDINQFSNEELGGPGNRLKRISYYNHTNQEETYTEYKYKGLDNKSSGKMFSIPDYLLILRNPYLPPNTIITRGSLFNFKGAYGERYDSSPINMFNTNDYGYEIIEESNNISKVKREYTVFKDAGEYYIYPFHLSIDLSWTRGKLLAETYYKKLGESWSVEKQVTNKYEFYNETSHPFAWSTGNTIKIGNPDEKLPVEELEPKALKYLISPKKTIFPLYKFHHYMDISNPGEVEKSYVIKDPNVFRKSYFVGGTMNLTSRETVLYENNLSIKTTENFSYSSVNHNQITERSLINSLGDVTTLKYKYASDITNNSIATQMSQQNILSNYLEKETTLNQTRVLKETNDFNNIGNNVLRLNSSKVEKGTSTDVYTLYTINYDGKANVSEVINTDNFKTTLLYGYNNSLLIAKIENASKEEVASALGVSVANLSTIDEGKLAQINNLRTNASLKEALITTYEHKPLVGVTKLTDPKGVYITYEYDGTNRLKAIKDKDGNILNEYEYNYKNN